MLEVSFLVKSGTCGWFDYDGCDLCLKSIKRENNDFAIPPIGSKIVINDTIEHWHNKYIVNDVEIYYGDCKDPERASYTECSILCRRNF